MFCVSSKIMMIARRGARVTPARSPPIPRSAYPPTGDWIHGNTRPVSFATIPPRDAPTMRAGVKTPPTPPDPMVAEVAAIFATKSSESFRNVGFPRRIRSVPPKPLPHTSGQKIPRTPTIAPPIAMEIGREIRREVKSSFACAEHPDEEGRGHARGETDREEGNELEHGFEPERSDLVDRLVPQEKRTRTVDVTAETTAGPKSVMENEPTTTSSTKSVAAIGVL